MSERRSGNLRSVLEYYKALGFEEVPLSAQFFFVSPERTDLVPPVKISKAEALDALRQEIGDCRRCKLAAGRTRLVFGEGSPGARIMFIGEGPGRDEDLQGRPFVGEAGQILTSLINKMGETGGFTRSDVYIANIVKCRPPMNRDPEPDEIQSCLPFLKRQVSIVAPEVIMCLGKISAYTLLQPQESLGRFSIGRMRGKFYPFECNGKEIPVMPTFHPAYFLRNPRDKHLTWADAQAVLALLDRQKGRSGREDSR